MFQTHELGQILRQLYVDGNPYKFLSSSYLRDEVKTFRPSFNRLVKR